MDAGPSNASSSMSAAPVDSTLLPIISTIDDVVSLIRSVEAAPDFTTSSASTLVPTQVYDELLPALKRQYHSQKGKGQRVFVQALQGSIDPLSMLDPARNTLGYAYILACRTSQTTDVGVAQVLTEYVDNFARFFTPAQLIGAGEISEHEKRWGRTVSKGITNTPLQ